MVWIELFEKEPLVGWGYNRGWNNYYPVIGVQGYIGDCLPESRTLHDFFCFCSFFSLEKKNIAKPSKKCGRRKPHVCLVPGRLPTRAFRRHETDRGMHLQLLFLRWNASLQQVCTLDPTYELGWQRDQLSFVVGVGAGWWFRLMFFKGGWNWTTLLYRDSGFFFIGKL